MDRKWMEAFENTTHLVEQGEAIYNDIAANRPEGMDVFICPEHMGDTLWVAALIEAYIREKNCDGVYVAVKESQNEMVNHFPGVTGTFILDNDEMLMLRYYFIASGRWNEDHIIFAHHRARLIYDHPVYYMHQYVDTPGLDLNRKRMLGLSDSAPYARMLPVCDGMNAEWKEKFAHAVLLFPVAQSMGRIPDRFWERLVSAYKNRGYEVYTNYNGFKYEYVVPDTKPIGSSIMELAEMAPCFAQVIALRSGVCDLLIETKTNLSVIYNKRTNEKRVILRSDELYPEELFELADNGTTTCYQYAEESESELIEAFFKQLENGGNNR